MADGPQASSSKWSDLTARIVSALIMAALALACLFGGSMSWSAFVLVAFALMLRELARLCDQSLSFAKLAAIAALPLVLAVVIALLPGGLGAQGEAGWAPSLLPALVVAVLPIALVLFVLGDGQRIWLVYGMMLATAALTLTFLHPSLGPWAVLALISTIVISDVAGYFAGRAFGGPKFWPRISPKKTWSGTVAGWIGAGLFGALIGPSVFGAPMLSSAILAAFIALAGQMGDISESWIKRHAGVKDSSRLIPGHGGVLDRLDALVAAAALVGVIALVTGAYM